MGGWIVTVGCFDILHVGHVDSIRYAHQHWGGGHTLVVGLATDDSVRQSKGTGRPICTLTDRMRMVSALYEVDWVAFYEGTNAANWISNLKPSIYFKGGDYTLETMDQDERRALESCGCEIRFTPYTPMHSTTELIRKISELPKPEPK